MCGRGGGSETTAHATRELHTRLGNYDPRLENYHHISDSGTTYQRLGNFRHASRQSETTTAKRLGNEDRATRKPPCQRLGDHNGSTRKLWPRLEHYDRESATAATNWKLNICPRNQSSELHPILPLMRQFDKLMVWWGWPGLGCLPGLPGLAGLADWAGLAGWAG